MNKQDLLAKVTIRKKGSLAQLMTISFEELNEKFEFTKFQLVEDRTRDVYRLLCEIDEEQYVSVKVSSKIELKRKDAIRDLINNYTIYAGVSNVKNEKGVEEERTWFTFGPEPSSNEPVEVITAKDLVNKKAPL